MKEFWVVRMRTVVTMLVTIYTNGEDRTHRLQFLIQMYL